MAKVKDFQKNPKVANFMKTVGKSMKIIATDVIQKENLLTSTRAELKVYNDFFTQIKNKRNERRELALGDRQLNRTRVYNNSNKFMENAWDNLKHSNLYNEEREFDFDEDEMSDVDNTTINDSIRESGKVTASMIGSVGEYVVSNIRISNSLNRNYQDKILRSTTQGFSILSKYLDKIDQNTSQLAAHMSNSQVYYENSLNLQKQLVEVTTALYENQTTVANKNLATGGPTSFDRIYGRGYFDFKEYFKEVGMNLSHMLSGSSMSGINYRLIDPVLSTDISKLKTNPIETVIALFARLAMRNISSVDGFVKGISEKIDNFLPNLMATINEFEPKTKFGKALVQALGLKIEEKNKIDLSKYDKGPVPFDGITRRAIVKVIPEYLARIESALTGKEERYMDIDSGRWVTQSKLKERNKEFKDAGFKAATKDMRKALEAAALNDPRYKSVIEDYLRQKYNYGRITKKGVSSGGADRKLVYDIARKQYGLTAKEAAEVVKALDSGDFQKYINSSALKFAQAKNEQNKRIANAESMGINLITMDKEATQIAARGGRVAGRRGEPQLVIATAGEKISNKSFSPSEIARNEQRERAYADSLGLNVSNYALGGTIGKAKATISNIYNKGKEKVNNLVDVLKSEDAVDFIHSIIPSVDRQKIENITKKASVAIPRGLKGAGLGTVIGFLSGVPVLGLSIGAGVGIASSSDTVKKFLFGTEEAVDEEGNVIPAKEGLIKKKWLDKINKFLPSAKSGAILGGLAGLLSKNIGILPGAIIGTGLNVALHSEKVSNFLFGEIDETTGERQDNGLISKKVQDYVKNHVPGMAVGAVAGMLTNGPFGLLGNAVMGAGLGLVATSDTFKKFMLGDPDSDKPFYKKGGLLGSLKVGLLDPLLDTGKELVEGLKKFFKDNVLTNVKKVLDLGNNLIENVVENVKNFIESRISNGSTPLGEKILSYTRQGIQFGKKILTSPVRFAGKVAALPFKAAGNIFDKITDRLVSRGGITNMTAEERLTYRRGRKGLNKFDDNYVEADNVMANMSTAQIERLTQVLESLKMSPNLDEANRVGAELAEEFGTYVRAKKYEISEPEIRKFEKYLATGDTVNFYKELQKITGKTISTEQAKDIIHHFDTSIQVLAYLNSKREQIRGNRQNVLDSVKKTFGIKGKFNAMGLGRLKKVLGKELESRKAAEEAEKQAKEDETNFTNPEGDKYENAFRKVVTDKLDKLIVLLTGVEENTEEAKDEAKKAAETGEAPETAENKEASTTASSKIDRKGRLAKYKEFAKTQRNRFMNKMKLSMGFGFDTIGFVSGSHDMAGLDSTLVKTLLKIKGKVENEPEVVNTILNTKPPLKDQILELIDIMKFDFKTYLKIYNILMLKRYLQYNLKDKYEIVKEMFTLIFKKGKFVITNNDDGEDNDLGILLKKCIYTQEGLNNLTQNLKLVKFTGINRDPEFVAECTVNLYTEASDITSKDRSANKFFGSKGRLTRGAKKVFNTAKDLAGKVKKQIKTSVNRFSLGMNYGFGAVRGLDKMGIDFSTIDSNTMRMLRKLNVKILSLGGTRSPLAYILKSENKDQILDLIDIMKVGLTYSLTPADIITIDFAIQKYKDNYELLREFFELVFKKGKFRLQNPGDLDKLLKGANITSEGIEQLRQNLRYVKFGNLLGGKNINDDVDFVIECTKRPIEENEKDASGKYRQNRLRGKLVRGTTKLLETGKKIGTKLTNAGKKVLAFGQKVLFGSKEKSNDEITGIFDYVKNNGILGSFKSLFIGDKNSSIKFFSKGGILGAVGSIPKKALGFLFGKDKENGKSIFERHGLLGYIPAAIFGDDKSDGLLGKTLLGKGVKLAGKILKGLLIAAIAAPVIGQAVKFFKETLTPVWNTVIKPWWNQNIIQPISERLSKIGKTLFGEKKTDENGEEYYDGGILSGLANKISKPLRSIRRFFFGSKEGEEPQEGIIDRIKRWWEDKTAGAEGDTFFSKLKYVLIGKQNDRENSLVGGLWAFIKEGYSEIYSTIIKPIKTWITDTAAPWISGLVQTLWHNIWDKKNPWEDFSSSTLIARGSNKFSSESNAPYYSSELGGMVNPNTGKLLEDKDLPTYFDENSGITIRSTQEEYNKFYSGAIEAPNHSGYIFRSKSNITIRNVDGYIDAQGHQIYYISGKARYNTNTYIDSNGYAISNYGAYETETNLNYYYYKENSIFKLAPSFAGAGKYDKLAYYAKKQNKKYLGNALFYCVYNETYYVKKFGTVEAVDGISPESLDEEESSGSSRRRKSRISGLARHIYQNDPSIKNKRFGNSTIGDAGCGPVAAANLIGGGALEYATQYAQNGGFVDNNGGTDISYFSSMFGGETTENKNKVNDRLKNNQPVVLLGKDTPNGVYGSNNHYVTAKGYDKNGNIVVEDPDLPQSIMKYKPSKVFKGMKAASLIGGKAREDEESNETTTNESPTNIVSSIISKFGNLSNLIMRKIFGITWTDVFGSKTKTSEGSENYSNEFSSYTYRGDERSRFLEVAKSQVGYHEGDNNDNKYGKWYGVNNQPWCVIFVSWCANQAGIAKNKIPKMASTTSMYHWFDDRARFHIRGSYVPNPGDIIFFTESSNGSRAGLYHTGIVESVVDTVLTTIEGNYNDQVSRRIFEDYNNEISIYGFAAPAFSADQKTITINGLYHSSGDLEGSTDKEKIWKYLRNNVGLTSVGASGLFGAWQAESGLTPKRVEYDTSSAFPGHEAIESSNGELLDKFARETLFPQYDKQGLSYSKNGYLYDGKYWPGLGLAQWTGSRAKKLFDFKNNNGYNSIWDLNTQLDYAKNEFDTSYPNLINNLNSQTTPEGAAKVALDGYEMYNGFADKRPDIYNPRAKNARNFYEEYKGYGRNSKLPLSATTEWKNINNKNYRVSSNGFVGGAPRTTTSASYVSYEEFLNVIIKILLNISTNTEAVNKILEIMSSEGNGLSAKARADISEALKNKDKTSEDTVKALLLNNLNSGSTTGISSLLSNTRSDRIIMAMKEIAAQ